MISSHNPQRTMPRSHRVHFVLLLASVLLAGCGKKEAPAPPPAPAMETMEAAKVDTAHQAAAEGKPTPIAGAAAAGQKIFYSTTYGKIKDACASCHTDGLPTTKDTRLRPGHTLAGVTSRTSTWNGEFKGEALAKNAYGATVCAVMYLHKGNDVATVLPK